MERLAIEVTVIALTYLIGHHMGYRKCFDRLWNGYLRDRLKRNIEDDLHDH